jgi:hypothetical protein
MGNHAYGAGFRIRLSCWRTTAALGSTVSVRVRALRVTMPQALTFAQSVTRSWMNTRPPKMNCQR